ncbi:hypothetical protein [Corynebacterium durum]|nr:hypothetical protein [Corynebacterium durum]
MWFVVVCLGCILLLIREGLTVEFTVFHHGKQDIDVPAVPK